MGGVAPERPAFSDERGVLTNTARLYGRSPRGARACASAPFGHWTRLAEAHGVRVHLTTAHRALRRAGWT